MSAHETDREKGVRKTKGTQKRINYKSTREEKS